MPASSLENPNVICVRSFVPNEIKATCDALHEFNPMMGHRGCRLAVTYPEIAEMQTRAVMEAAIEVHEEKGYNIIPEIMIPLVGEKKELKFVKDIVVNTAEAVKAEKNSDMHYKIGTMIEIPRAALLADEIASEAEFFSFGTNDLTQMTFGFSTAIFTSCPTPFLSRRANGSDSYILFL